MPSLLIVCPIPEHHMVVEEALRNTAWAIFHASSCAAAARHLAEQRPSAILCEHRLPDGTWREMLRMAEEFSPPIPLVVSSLFADHGLWSEVLNLGGFDVIPQPFDDAELVRILEAAARRSTSASSQTA